MADMGLNVSDLSLHGNSRELVMKGWQHNARYNEENFILKLDINCLHLI